MQTTVHEYLSQHDSLQPPSGNNLNVHQLINGWSGMYFAICGNAMFVNHKKSEQQ